MTTREQMLETLNYHGDIRNTVATEAVIEVWNPETGVSEEITLPTKNELCPACDGEGKTVDPAIDCGGLTAEDFEEDPEFAERYFAGAYDVRCRHCKGEKVVKVPDFSKLSKEQRKAWNSRREAEDRIHQERLAEIRFGA